VNRREIYSNPWLTLHEHDVIHPDGSEGIYSVVDMRTATAVVALTPAREVYLVGQYRYPIERYSWEVVEGGAERGEEPLAAAQRELQEEAGLVAANWVQLGDTLHLSNCVTNEEGYIYLARDLSHVVAAPEPTEVLQVKTVPLDECLDMVLRGDITDAMSVMGIFFTERYLREND
jgi:8-oxo-dGTP pyrophosphatase MutT (NUDIX family)